MKNKDYIEDLISNNLDELNDNEPSLKHFKRFEEKLKKHEKKSGKLKLNLIWKVAAIAIILLLTGNQAIIYFSPEGKGLFMKNSSSTNVTLASVSSEYGEVEQYYTSAIHTGLNQWDKLLEEGLVSEEEQAMMDEELKEFETLFKGLQKDLKTNPNDERVINAMLEYYHAKLNVITLIVTKLEEVKQQKNNSYEEV
jgi:hypothetical protein